MADRLGPIGALAAVAVGLIAARGSFASADTGDAAASTVINQQVGQRVTMSRVQVQSVPADEGFWVDSDHGRVWVQIDTRRESPYTVSRGEVVSFTGTVVAHGQDYPAQVGVTGSEGAAALAAQGAHIRIPVNGIAFDH
jgi:hypothetical protein